MAKDFCHLLVALKAVVPLGKKQCDVRVIGTGDPIAHEHAGIGINEADTLIIANLAGNRL